MQRPKKEKVISKKEAYLRLCSYCGYQERSGLEVYEKLRKLQLDEVAIHEIIYQLREENYLNEERFAKIYTGGKYRVNKWGKNKIKEGLRQKGIPEDIIEEALKEVEAADYSKILFKQLEKKISEIRKKESDPFVIKAKLARFAMLKGYESDKVWAAINVLMV